MLDCSSIVIFPFSSQASVVVVVVCLGDGEEDVMNQSSLLYCMVTGDGSRKFRVFSPACASGTVYDVQRCVLSCHTN
jgi:hypothetical protein